MELNYLCPECKSLLNIGERIVLSVRLINKQNGLVLFEQILGDYKIKKQEVLHFRDGDMVEFFCPICHENLQSSINSNLAKIIQLDETDTECEIYFSRIAGEHATYKIKNGQVESFGHNQDIYLHLFKQNGI